MAAAYSAEQHALRALAAAHELHARAGGAGPAGASRPPIYKIIGIVLAVSSGAFIGCSFCFKKYGLLKANERYNEVAGEGYGYLKNIWWWTGMILMIVGEICNFVAYAFTDAILVTPLGALSVVITAILSAVFLKERLSMVGKVACFLCIVGSVVIVMNAPQESSVANIQQMQSFVITPGFLSYTGVVVVGCVIVALYAGPRWGKKNMLVYISICSWIGGLSVVATQGLGAAILTQIGGTAQFNVWFTYVLLAFVISTLLTEIIYLNKALNLFNAAMVTPTYYVYFTSTTIVTSTVLFQGFKGTASSIITVVNGFLTICAGVVLLQLSKSAKDVPDAAVFSGDLDQIHTIAEQEQPETEPKADAIRGTAAIVRRISSRRLRMEAEELKRLHEEKQREALEPLSEDGMVQFEWDGLRRRKTIGSRRSRAMTSPGPMTPFPPLPHTPVQQQQVHPPLGWSHFPTQEELDAIDRPGTSGALSGIVGTIRTRARSVLLPGHPEFRGDEEGQTKQARNPMQPVQSREVSVPTHNRGSEAGGPYSGSGADTALGRGSATAYQDSNHSLGVPGSLHSAGNGARGRAPSQFSQASSLGPPPTPPPHSTRRQFSFQRVFRRHHDHTGGAGFDDVDERTSISQHQQSPPRPVVTPRGYSSPQVRGATEEERLGLVTGDSHSMPTLPHFGGRLDELDDDDGYSPAVKKDSKYGRAITSPSSPTRGSVDEEKEMLADYEARRSRWNESRGGGGGRGGSSRHSPPPPPRHSPPPGGNGAFV